MNLFLYQIKQAYLSLKQKPGFVFSVVSTMGITLGALLCVLTLAYVMLFKPLPYPDQDRLYKVEQQTIAFNGTEVFNAFDYPTIVALYKNQRAFESVSISHSSDQVIHSHTQQPKVRTTYVTPEWYSLLNVPMVLGRYLQVEEGLNSHIPVAILSYKMWQKKYNADVDIVDKKLTINDVSYQIIGVVADEFIEPKVSDLGVETELWLPWDFNAINYQKDWWASYNPNFVYIGKLKKELSNLQAEQQLTAYIEELIQPLVVDDAFFRDAKIQAKISKLQSAMTAGKSQTVFILLAAVSALVIIASANIIHLFIANIAQQKESLAINAAIGARLKQLFLSLVLQITMLMCISMLLAFFVADVGFYFIKYYFSSYLPRINELAFHGTSVFFCIVVAMLVVVFFAKFALATINYQQLVSILDNSGKGSGLQISSKLRTSLIVSQIVIACVLVFLGAVLMVNAMEIIKQPLGYQRDSISYLEVHIRKSDNNKGSRVEQNFSLISQLKIKLLALPEIDSISTAESPLSNFMSLEARDISSGSIYMVKTSFGDENYFNLLSQSLISGDNFSKQTKQDRDQVIIINDVLAQKLSGDKSPIGRKIDLSGDSSNVVTVIGVVSSISFPGGEKNSAQMYLPSSVLTAKFLIKFKENQQLNRNNLLSNVKSISNRLTIYEYKSLEEKHKDIVFPERITLMMTIILIIIALLLAGLGLYGILNYSSQIRRFEIGTRMAIGAKGKEIVALIIKDNAGALFIGVAVSILILLGLYLGFSEQLTQYINLALIPLFIITLLLISLVSFFACYLPLRQYIKQPVMHSLRGSE